MPNKPKLYFSNRAEWRQWLEENHDISSGIWLIYYKKHTGRERIPYDDAVEEALCYGWIDSTIRRIDEEKYCQKFTPRRKGSLWSELNKARVKKLDDLGLIREPGKKKIREAKASGIWDRSHPSLTLPRTCPDLESALEGDPAAKKHFSELPPSKRKMIAGWIMQAKRDETRIKRLMEVLDLLRDGKELGMK